MDLEKELISDERFQYKCFDELKRLIHEDKNFYQTLLNGIKAEKVLGFPEDLWEKINKQNIRGIDNFETVFKEGANIGYCTVAAKQLSYSFSNCYLCGGVLPILKGTRNCPDGSHTWILVNNKIIDTTLMLIISEDYANKLGYIEENRYDPSIDPIYNASKEFTNDSNLKRK